MVGLSLLFWRFIFELHSGKVTRNPEEEGFEKKIECRDGVWFLWVPRESGVLGGKLHAVFLVGTPCYLE